MRKAKIKKEEKPEQLSKILEHLENINKKQEEINEQSKTLWDLELKEQNIRLSSWDIEMALEEKKNAVAFKKIDIETADAQVLIATNLSALLERLEKREELSAELPALEEMVKEQTVLFDKKKRELLLQQMSIKRLREQIRSIKRTIEKEKAEIHSLEEDA